MKLHYLDWRVHVRDHVLRKHMTYIVKKVKHPASLILLMDLSMQQNILRSFKKHFHHQRNNLSAKWGPDFFVLLIPLANSDIFPKDIWDNFTSKDCHYFYLHNGNYTFVVFIILGQLFWIDNFFKNRTLIVKYKLRDFRYVH